MIEVRMSAISGRAARVSTKSRRWSVDGTATWATKSLAPVTM